MNTSTTPGEQHPPHPFGQLLEADEPLLWLARPNRDVFQAQQAKILLYIFGFSSATIFLLGGWPFKSQENAFHVVLSFIFAWIGVGVANWTRNGDDEWSITWYALTPRRLLKQARDGDAPGGCRIAQIALTDLRRLRLRRRHIRPGTSIGTITCYTRARLVLVHFTLDAVENPDEVLGLIEDARTHISAARN